VLQRTGLTVDAGRTWVEAHPETSGRFTRFHHTKGVGGAGGEFRGAHFGPYEIGRNCGQLVAPAPSVAAL